MTVAFIILAVIAATGWIAAGFLYSRLSRRVTQEPQPVVVQTALTLTPELFQQPEPDPEPEPVQAPAVERVLRLIRSRKVKPVPVAEPEPQVKVGVPDLPVAVAPLKPEPRVHRASRMWAQSVPKHKTPHGKRTH